MSRVRRSWPGAWRTRPPASPALNTALASVILGDSMSSSSDEIALSEVRLCKLADVPRQSRRNWAANELLAERPGGSYGRLDLLELVACARLMRALGPSDGRAAWTQIREPYGRHVLAGRVDVVFSEADH